MIIINPKSTETKAERVPVKISNNEAKVKFIKLTSILTREFSGLIKSYITQKQAKMAQLTICGMCLKIPMNRAPLKLVPGNTINATKLIQHKLSVMNLKTLRKFSGFKDVGTIRPNKTTVKLAKNADASCKIKDSSEFTNKLCNNVIKSR